MTASESAHLEQLAQGGQFGRVAQLAQRAAGLVPAVCVACFGD